MIPSLPKFCASNSMLKNTTEIKFTKESRKRAADDAPADEEVMGRHTPDGGNRNITLNHGNGSIFNIN